MSAGEARRAARQHFVTAENSGSNHSVQLLHYGLAYLRMEECCEKLIVALERIAKTPTSRKPGQEWVHWITQAEESLKDVQS